MEFSSRIALEEENDIHVSNREIPEVLNTDMCTYVVSTTFVGLSQI